MTEDECRAYANAPGNLWGGNSWNIAYSHPRGCVLINNVQGAWGTFVGYYFETQKIHPDNVNGAHTGQYYNEYKHAFCPMFQDDIRCIQKDIVC